MLINFGYKNETRDFYLRFLEIRLSFGGKAWICVAQKIVGDFTQKLLKEFENLIRGT
jgi:hypothetical protein